MTEPVNNKDQLIQNIKDGKPVIANVRFSQPFVFDPKDNKGIVIANCVGGQQNPTVNNEWIDDIFEEMLNWVIANHSYIASGGKPNDPTIANAKLAILSKLESIEQEAYKRGYIQRGVDETHNIAKYMNKQRELKGKG